MHENCLAPCLALCPTEWALNTCYCSKEQGERKCKSFRAWRETRGKVYIVRGKRAGQTLGGAWLELYRQITSLGLGLPAVTSKIPSSASTTSDTSWELKKLLNVRLNEQVHRHLTAQREDRDHSVLLVSLSLRRMRLLPYRTIRDRDVWNSQGS